MWRILLSAWRERRRGAWLLVAAFLAVVLWAPAGRAADEVAAAKPNVAVLYPDIGEPYRAVFANMIEGIQERWPGRVTSFPLAMGGNPPNLNEALRQRDIKVVIALGRSGLKVAAALSDKQVAVVAGGVLSVPESEAQDMLIQSLAPDPALMFARLKSFAPATKRIVVIYDPRQNDWLIRLAREAAKAQGLELLAMEAEDLKTAVRRYQEILSTASSRRDALWLPQDTTTVDESAVLPLVLRESWDLNLIVFSSNVAHVRRGVLFSLYPDNVEIGRFLAGAALTSVQAGGGASRGIQALKQVRTAVNTRTADHLGLDMRASQQRIHLVFPEQ